MTLTIVAILQLFAFLCFVAAAVGVQAKVTVNLTAAGLAIWMFSLLISHA